MIYLPVSILLFLLFLLLLPFISLAVALDVVEVAVAKLGLSSNVAFLLFVAVLIGSTINIPLYKVNSIKPVIPDFRDLWLRQFWGIPLHQLSRSNWSVAT